ncbi:MAG: CHASE2 domain-containing protein [Spirulina sp. SIO3F2]|nr:CHASE2 domain-containing protein [Spirulina sp. SIO3F2]
MTKLVVLEFDGSLDIGFRVTLALGEEGQTARLRRKGNLPAAPELLSQLEHHWQESYRPLGAPYSRFWQGDEAGLDFRIKPKRVLSHSPLKEQIETCHRSAQKLETALNDWLSSDSFREIDRTLRQELSPQDQARVLLHTNDLSFQKLPWEEWDFLDRYPQAVSSFSPLEAKTTIELPPITSTGTVRILAILGHSGGIDVEHDRALIQQLPYAEAVFLEQPTLKDISDRLWNESWDILFFAGHSETQGQQGIIHISPTESLTIEQLWYNLRRAVDRGLQLAIFNSCDGLGLSQRLDDLHIPQMILMRELVPDRVAHQFLTHFLQEFAAGESLYGAVRQARERLHDELEREIPCASWLPVICQNPLVLPPSWEQLAGLELEPQPQAAPVIAPEPSPRSQPRRDWRWSLMVSLLVAIAVIFVRSWGWLQPLEWWAYDTMLRSRPVEPPDDRVVLVEITQHDFEHYQFEKYGQGSINDEKLYELLQKIDEQKPAAIGLMFFRDKPVDVKLPELKDYLQANKHIYGICYMGNPQGGTHDIKGSTSIPNTRLGFSNTISDADAVIRRQFLYLKAEENSDCPVTGSISLRLAEHYIKVNAPEYEFEMLNGEDLIAGNKPFTRLSLARGIYQKDEASAYQVLLNYRGKPEIDDGIKTLRLSNILETEDIEPFELSNRVVIIGITKRDIHRHLTPYGDMPGAVLQSQMTSQLINYILEDRPLIRFLPNWLEYLWIMAWTIIIGGIRKYNVKTWLFFILTLCISVISFQILLRGFWVPLIPTLIGITLVFVLSQSNSDSMISLARRNNNDI